MSENINEYLPEEILGDKLSKKQLTLSTAESCTGGYIAHKITMVAGASKYFVGSIVSYANSAKEELLNVDNEVIELYGVVSKEVVEQMVVNVAKVLKTDCSIAVSGYMGPSGGTKEEPVGTVWISTMYNNKISSIQYYVDGSRKQNIEKTTNLAILQLLMMVS